MNRREVFRSMFGLPVAIAGIAVAKVAPVLALEPSAVSTGFVVHENKDGRFFDAILLKKPWPHVGDSVSLDFGHFHFKGTVTSTDIHSPKGSDRLKCRVQGTVAELDGQGLKD